MTTPVDNNSLTFNETELFIRFTHVKIKHTHNGCPGAKVTHHNRVLFICKASIMIFRLAKSPLAYVTRTETRLQV